MKGAIREIRKDNAFIAREKLKEQIDKYVTSKFCLSVLYRFVTDLFETDRDNQRKRKVKELMASLADQEGEVKKLKKPKKK